MTAHEFRKMALRFQGALESEHMKHSDFRFKGKIFATLSPSHQGWGMLKRTLQQQRTVRDLGIVPSERLSVHQRTATRAGLGGATAIVLWAVRHATDVHGQAGS